MKILPINNLQYVNNKNSKTTYKPSFTHHPDFLKLQHEYEICASSYFRRGSFYGSPSDKFIDIVKALEKVFDKDSLKGKKKMLIGGIGESQEPFSLLAVIKSFINHKHLRQVVDTNIIDLQSRPGKTELIYQSYYDGYGRPNYVPESFVQQETTAHGLSRVMKYRVCDEILNYLSSVYNNPQKSKWESKIQDAVKEYPDNSFDIISVNNTIGYITDFSEGMDVLKNIYRILKSGGIFITDPEYRKFLLVFTPKLADEIYPGIYQKK